jgi:aspartyl-tRNA(Asn)/glutamyl-tRNA(Gln) amidotransferase subunit A
MTAIHTLGAAELQAAYRSGELSPVEVLQALHAHIADWEPHLHALYAADPAAALVQARESEARWRANRPLSALDGVPVTIKENIATRGTPVPLGTAATEPVPAAADAPPAARLREAGALLLAKTTMPDYGMLSSGLSSFHPLTRNPWDLSKNPGGSSAGAGAAAAAGYAPLHIGTDIGGSIRLPAGWCGVVGLKPSAGRVPIDPPFIGRVAGPLTRSVQDAALAMQVLSQPDGRDATSLPPASTAWSALDINLRGLKIGLWLDAGWGLPVEPEIQAAIEAAARAFANAGACIEPVRAFTTRPMVEGLDRFWRARLWSELVSLPKARRDAVLPYIRQWAEGAAHLSGNQVFLGFSQIAALRDAAVAACAPYDFVLSPVSPMPAFAAAAASPLDDPARPFEHIAFTLPFNMSEQPSISVPCGFTAAGLPIGLQITGPRHADHAVLRVAHAWEQLRGPLRALPPAPVASVTPPVR